MVLGHLLTGSNFDDTKEAVTGGRHGYGAKLTNIFSVFFQVETVDSKRGLRYRQQWRDNMKVCDPPVIEPAPGVKDYTRITFAPDVRSACCSWLCLLPLRTAADRVDRVVNAGFGSSCITPGTLKIMHRRLLDVAGTTQGQIVSLNGEPLPVSGFQQYVSAFCQSDAAPVFCKLNSRWEFGVAVAEDANASPVSFVNGIYTHRGGTHVHAVADALCKKLAAYLTKHAPNGQPRPH
jgi:DNA topoisomerase-2